MLKGYCQRKHSERLTNIETEQKATFDMYIKLEKGEKIINKQKQFKCPISHYMMSHERFGVLEYDTERTIRYKDDDGKIIYSKGIVIEQDIKFDEDYIVDNKVSSDDFGVVEISDSDWFEADQWSDKIIDTNTNKIIVNPNYVNPLGPTLAIRTIPFTDLAKLK